MEMMIEIVKHTIMITSFVFVMMLIIEYINVLTSGSWQESLAQSRWTQYLIAAILGATPGCLGAFIVVTMYSHRIITLGALVTAMIATCGDESFVMLAIIPKDGIIIIGILAFIGILFGIIVDLIYNENRKKDVPGCEGLAQHLPDYCNCYPKGEILNQWKNCTISRGVLCITIFILIFLSISGQMEPHEWNWVKITILFTMCIALFIVATVPDHFLEDHLWDHVAKRHIPRIFLWTLGALIVMHILIDLLNIEGLIRGNEWFTMIIAGLVGLIPESGPHLIFVTMYAKKIIPISILLVSSIVQDGHGMLPLLAHSRLDFIKVKVINLIAGLIVGSILLLLGF
ncbi:MAG: putative manganese transporter [Spirochaetota bacterium]|nr:putative manganese transporter [Spirochaetota bacterium]